MSKENGNNTLPTEDELRAALGEPEPRKPVEYSINKNPRVIRIDRNTNTELPPEIKDNREQPDKKELQNKQTKEEDNSIPEKFKGKSKEEIASAYVNLEKELGRMRNEMGDMRGIIERVATMKRRDDLGLEEDGDNAVSITSDELLTNPAEAISKVVSSSTKKQTRTLEEDVGSIKAEIALNRFRDKHPTFEQDMQDPVFMEWVSKSVYRQRLATAAAQRGDLDAADELFTAWEEVRDEVSGKNSRRSDTEGQHGNFDGDEARNKALRDARLERGSSSGLSAFDGRTFSRREILEMRLNKPDLYYSDEMQAIIAKAYAEGRVK